MRWRVCRNTRLLASTAGRSAHMKGTPTECWDTREGAKVLCLDSQGTPCCIMSPQNPGVEVPGPTLRPDLAIGSLQMPFRKVRSSPEK